MLAASLAVFAGGLALAIPLGSCSNLYNAVRFAHIHFCFSALSKQAWQGLKTKMPDKSGIIQFCGEGGIRTLDTSLSSYNGLANRPFRPLRHLSVNLELSAVQFSFDTFASLGIPSALFSKGRQK